MTDESEEGELTPCHDEWSDHTHRTRTTGDNHRYTDNSIHRRDSGPTRSSDTGYSISGSNSTTAARQHIAGAGGAGDTRRSNGKEEHHDNTATAAAAATHRHHGKRHEIKPGVGIRIASR